ncbi:hypothetical protein DFP72DRAFT_1171959 [Ephemerocybe angulata]|uniref:Uncharacterized protein n=1 Tax=Ephemerocybe angulata TaxID=980116 RepID=A0A8H6HT28_9AGAR|nr:hypothetical protein DFP72DRAFT_1171959 [Tulosesus angulatus]
MAHPPHSPPFALYKKRQRTQLVDYPEALPTRTLTTATPFHFRRFTATLDLDRHIPLASRAEWVTARGLDAMKVVVPHTTAAARTKTEDRGSGGELWSGSKSTLRFSAIWTWTLTDGKDLTLR